MVIKKIFLLLVSMFIVLFALVSCTCDKNNILSDSWEFYKREFISKDGRVIDPWRNDITTSEGQSYAMLRAVLIDDKKTFDLVYKWAQNNLNRENDRLFAWLWGKREDSSWGILDENAASDADIDIAFALILANKKWGNKDYLTDAKQIINDIWEYETKEINYQRALLSDVEQSNDQKTEINPSYFAPYAFRVFDEYDNKHNWQELVDSSYDLLNRITKATETGLPPDWFFMDIKTGEITFNKEKPQRSDFSYDAIRVFIRCYLDYIYSKDQRAFEIMEKCKFFMNKYPNPEKDSKFYTNYKIDADIRDEDENIGAIATLVPVFHLFDKEYAKAVYENKVLASYDTKGFWQNSENYYTQNLAWIGTWVYLNVQE